jgi:hypothetical protein
MLAQDLQAQSDSLAHWLLLWTIVVALGLVVEYAPDIWKAAGSALGFLLRKRPFDHSTLKRTVIGGILITVGVIGEAWIELRMPEVAAKIQSKNDLLIASLNYEAGEARKIAAQLETAMANRDLTPEQQHRIAEACRAFSGKIVYIRSYPNDVEAARLIMQLKTALEPHIRVEDRTGQLLATWDSPGLVLGIRIQPAEGERAFAEALVKTFRREGSLSVEDLSPLGAGQALTEILVGVKPVVYRPILKATRLFDAATKEMAH